MDLWTSQSNPAKQTALSLICTLAGLALTVGFRHFSSTDTNALAGFLLGLLLLGIGVIGFLVSGKQTVVIDPQARRITVEDSNRFGTKKRFIPFRDIAGISIGYLGKKSNFVEWYYLILELKNGEAYSTRPLFRGGFRHIYGGGLETTPRGISSIAGAVICSAIRPAPIPSGPHAPSRP